MGIAPTRAACSVQHQKTLFRVTSTNALESLQHMGWSVRQPWTKQSC